MKVKFSFILILVISGFGFKLFAQEKQEPKLLESLSYLEGIWQAPDSVLNKNPHMQGRAIFKFELDQNKTHLKMIEGFSLTDDADYDFMGVLAPNPLTGTFDFFGANVKSTYLFSGHFSNISQKGFRRVYEVSYPAESQVAKSLGQVVQFREDFEMEDENTMTFGILYFNKKSKQWENWSQKKHTVVRIN